jgi:hypothetical protein
MSRRRRVEEDPPESPDDEDELPDPDPDEEVEYFVEVDEEVVVTSVPNSVQSSQSSNSAPSTFVVVSEARSAPHISHCGMEECSAARVKKGTHGGANEGCQDE